MRYSDGVLPMVRFRRIQLFLGFLGALIVIGRVLFDGFQLEDIGPGELQKPSAGTKSCPKRSRRVSKAECGHEKWPQTFPAGDISTEP